MIWLPAIISTYWPSSSSVCKLTAIKVWPMKWIISSNNNKWATSILIRKRTRNTKVKVVINMLITGAAIRQSAIAGSLRAREVWNYRLHWWDPTFVAFSHMLAHIQQFSIWEAFHCNKNQFRNTVLVFAKRPTLMSSCLLTGFLPCVHCASWYFGLKWCAGGGSKVTGVMLYCNCKTMSMTKRTSRLSCELVRSQANTAAPLKPFEAMPCATVWDKLRFISPRNETRRHKLMEELHKKHGKMFRLHFPGLKHKPICCCLLFVFCLFVCLLFFLFVVCFFLLVCLSCTESMAKCSSSTS